MTYRELIKQVQVYSGFSDQESKDALDGTVTVLALHLPEGERRKFASQLPQELQAQALSVMPTAETATEDILEQFQVVQAVPADRAKKQFLSVWRALKSSLSGGLLDHVKAQLPNKTAGMLH